ncbi:MAG: chromate transporter [Alistipes sp.]|nr:chromate transporter [Alistipes sp.]
MILLQLFLSYLKIGFFGFGGGYAMLSLIQDEIVVRRGWLTGAEFADIIAVSQITPGPIAINSATYIGYTVAGVWGSIIATFAVCLPALTIMILFTRFFLKLHNNRYISGAVAGMKPVAIGMIVSAGLLLIFASGEGERNFIDTWSWIFFGGCLAGSYFKVNPILLIVIAALCGIIKYYVL